MTKKTYNKIIKKIYYNFSTWYDKTVADWPKQKKYLCRELDRELGEEFNIEFCECSVIWDFFDVVTGYPNIFNISNIDLEKSSWEDGQGKLLAEIIWAKLNDKQFTINLKS